MNQEERIQINEGEINLVDYIIVIKKRKNLIFSFFVIGLIGTAILTFSLSEKEKYKAETVIQLRETIESSNTLLEKINAGIYGIYPGIKAEAIGDTDLVKVEVIAEDPEEAKNSLETINELIITEQNSRIEIVIAKEKKILEENIKKIEKDINYFIYIDQQAVALKLKLYSLEEKLTDLQVIESVEIIKEPIILGKTDDGGPSLAFNMIIGGILWIFIGVIVALGREWLDKNKSRI